MSGPPAVWQAAGPVLAPLAVALAAISIIVAAAGENPAAALRTLAAGSLGSREGLAMTLFYTTDFIFAGLAVSVAFRAGLFNIGVEGQAMAAGIGIALAALYAGALPGALALPALALAGAAGGALWALVPAWLQARRGSHIVITTIMFNFIAGALLGFLLNGPLGAPGSMQPESPAFPAAAAMPRLDDALRAMGMTPTDTPLNLCLPLALAAAFAAHVLFERTRLGYEMAVLGASPPAAAYAGISPARIMMLAMILSGILGSGLALNELTGAQNRLILEFTGGYGFVGIAIALTGRNRPAGIVLAALLFGALYQGGAELAFERPKITRDMIVLVQGLIVLMAGCFGARARSGEA